MKNWFREGKGIYYYNNGDIYEGFWKNDKEEGKGITYYNREHCKDDRYVLLPKLHVPEKPYPPSGYTPQGKLGEGGMYFLEKCMNFLIFNNKFLSMNITFLGNLGDGVWVS